MSVTAEMQSDIEQSEQAYIPYRAISRGAVISLLLALVSLLCFLFFELLFVPIIGLVIGLLSWRAIRRSPLELTGKPFAVSGALLCAIIFVLSIVVHVTAFAFSVPDGYERISFDQLRSDLKGEVEHVPDSALQLNGKKVYIHGYLHPSVDSGEPVQRFVIVGEFSICCFGGQPKLTHMIEVTTPPDKAVQYSLKNHGFGGTLSVNTRLKPVGALGGVFYQLKADIVD